MVCVDVHFNSYKPISAFPEAINYGKEFFIINRQIAMCCGEGFCMILDGVKLLCYVDNVVLRQDAWYCFLTGIGFHYRLKRRIELCNNRGG